MNDRVVEEVTDLALELWYNGDAASWGQAAETARLFLPKAQNIEIDWDGEAIRQQWQQEAIP